MYQQRNIFKNKKLSHEIEVRKKTNVCLKVHKIFLICYNIIWFENINRIKQNEDEKTVSILLLLCNRKKCIWINIWFNLIQSKKYIFNMRKINI